MRIVAGILFSALELIYAGQIISVINFRLAQRLGLQGKPENIDPLASHIEP